MYEYADPRFLDPVGPTSLPPRFRAPFPAFPMVPQMSAPEPPSQQQTPGMGMPPLGMLTNFMGGGAGAGAGAGAASAAGGGASSLGASAGGSLSAGAGGAAAGGSGALGGMSAMGPAALFAALIGLGKNTENNHAGTPLGDGLLAGLGPSAAQIFEDPLGMGLPTLLGAPFLTPFTASDKAKKTAPEWQGLFGLGF
jgi:hypothetical protein